MSVILENNYCLVEDVLRASKLTSTPEPALLERINEAINQASRLIDTYCNTKFHEQDYSSNYYDLRFNDGWFANESNLFLPFPISQIAEIIEDGNVLALSNYILPNDSLAKIIRLIDDEPADWGIKIKIKGKFGYKGLNSCSSGYKSLPSQIKSQCAIFASYLLGYRKINEKSKARTGWENKSSSNVPLVTTSDTGTGSSTAYAFATDINTDTQLVKTYTGAVDIIKIDPVGVISTPVNNKTYSLGYQVPLNETITEQTSLDGLIPSFELQKLDPYRFLRL